MIGLKLISKLKLLGARLTRHNPNGLRIMSVTANVQKEFLSYQASISKLNELQMMPPGKVNGHSELVKLRVSYTRNMCAKLNLTDEDINGLNIIHITGTKGKGSTSAFIESILRHSGYKTGLFTSPHLIEVKERIKINGVSLSYDKFHEYFEHCFGLLHENWSENDPFDKPSYFQFLTCMMFYVFCKEGVQAAVVEVGIGGEYDNTNIIQKPIACGLASLGLDHCSILGDTLEKIAWQKSGIFKASSVAFTVNQHSPSVLEVLKRRAEERNTQLCLVPIVDKYFDSNRNELNIGLNGSIQYVNSSLALQICKYWMDNRNIKNFDKLKWIQENTHEWTKEDIPILKPVRELNETLKSSLVECKWPGRNQIIESDNKLVTYYLDGAHTNESIEQFLNWFLNLKKEDEHSLANERNVLIFNYTGERDPKKFLEILMNVKFDQIAFSKLEAFPSNFSTAENEDNVRKMPAVALDTESKYQRLLELCNEMNEKRGRNVKTEVFDSVLEALNWASYSDRTIKTNVLITGSLYLVGLSLKVLNYRIA